MRAEAWSRPHGCQVTEAPSGIFIRFAWYWNTRAAPRCACNEGGRLLVLLGRRN
jgi:hypothetical protein